MIASINVAVQTYWCINMPLGAANLIKPYISADKLYAIL